MDETEGEPTAEIPELFWASQTPVSAAESGTSVPHEGDEMPHSDRDADIGNAVGEEAEAAASKKQHLLTWGACALLALVILITGAVLSESRGEAQTPCDDYTTSSLQQRRSCCEDAEAGFSEHRSCCDDWRESEACCLRWRAASACCEHWQDDEICCARWRNDTECCAEWRAIDACCREWRRGNFDDRRDDGLYDAEDRFADNEPSRWAELC